MKSRVLGRTLRRSHNRTRVPGYMVKHNVLMPEGMTPQQFIAKWSRVELPERAASQEHFIDLYR